MKRKIIVLFVALLVMSCGSLGLPQAKAVKESLVEGRTVIRYEHDSTGLWGYEKPQSDYFTLTKAIESSIFETMNLSSGIR